MFSLDQKCTPNYHIHCSHTRCRCIAGGNGRVQVGWGLGSPQAEFRSWAPGRVWRQSPRSSKKVAIHKTVSCVINGQHSDPLTEKRSC